MSKLHIISRNWKHKKRRTTQALSVAVSLTLALSLFGAAGLPAFAEPGPDEFETPISDVLMNVADEATSNEFTQTPPILKIPIPGNRISETMRTTAQAQ